MHLRDKGGFVGRTRRLLGTPIPSRAYIVWGPVQNDVSDGPPFGATLTEDLDRFKGARSLSRSRIKGRKVPVHFLRD